MNTIQTKVPASPPSVHSTVVDPEEVKAEQVVMTFIKKYWVDDSIQSVGGSKHEGKWCIHVIGTEAALAKIPNESDDKVYTVVKEVRTGGKVEATETTIIGGAAFMESVHDLDYEQIKSMHEQFSLKLAKLGIVYMSYFEKQDGKWRFNVTVKNEGDLNKVYDNWGGIDVIKTADKTLGLQ